MLIGADGHKQASTGHSQLSAASLAKQLTKYGEMAQVCCLTCHEHNQAMLRQKEK